MFCIAIALCCASCTAPNIQARPTAVSFEAENTITTPGNLESFSFDAAPISITPTPNALQTPSITFSEDGENSLLIDLYSQYSCSMVSQFPCGEGECLSPDGNWLVTQTTPLTIVSTNDPEKVLKASVPNNGLELRYITAWSPDSSLLTQTITWGKCGNHKLLVFRIIDQNRLEYKTFELPDNDNGCFDVTWSYDPTFRTCG
jgi:hypothetical protein